MTHSARSYAFPRSFLGSLLFNIGGFVQLGESPETDRRILIAADEVIKDIFFEATVLISWRLLRSKMNDEFFAKFK
jgi:hypothetical protein